MGVGLSVVYEGTRSAPVGLRDSKLLSEQRREELHPAVAAWSRNAVGLASNEEVESIGIIAALGRRRGARDRGAARDRASRSRMRWCCSTDRTTG